MQSPTLRLLCIALLACSLSVAHAAFLETSSFNLSGLPLLANQTEQVFPTYVTVRGVAFSPEAGGIVYFTTRSTRLSSISAYSLKNHSITMLIGEGGLNCEPGKWEASPDAAISARGLDLINEKNLLFADAMPSSNVFLLSSLHPWTSLLLGPNMYHFTSVLGAGCNYTQKTLKNNSIASEGAVIGPPRYIKYRSSTNQLFFDQHYFLGVVEDDVARVYLGSYLSGPNQGAEALKDKFRTEVRCGALGQFDILDDNTMYITDRSHPGVRQVSLETGMTHIVIGSISSRFPPINCTKKEPCALLTVELLDPRALVAWRHPETGKPYLYFSDFTAAVIYQSDLTTGTTFAIAGQMLYAGYTDGDPSVSEVGLLSQLTVSSTTLFWGDRESIRYIDLVTPEASVNATFKISPFDGCDLIKDCSGRAVKVTGIPASKCRCTCRVGWKGEDCSEREEWNIVTESRTLIYRPPVPAPIPPKLREVTVRTVTATTMISATVVNPAIAAQTQRSSLLLRIARCEKEYGEPLDFTQNLAQIAIGESELRFYYGATVGNCVIYLTCLLLHALIGYNYMRCTGGTLREAFAVVRFPSLAVFPTMLMFEGTMMSSATLVVNASAADMLAAGFFGLFLCLCVIIVAGFVLVRGFHATFVEYTSADRPESVAGRVKHFLLHGTGKWTDEPGYWYRRRFGSFFENYRGGRQYFLVFELLMCGACGLLDAIRPGTGNCFKVLLCLMAVYFVFFIALVVLKPFTTKLEYVVCVIVAGLQAFASAFLVAFATAEIDMFEAISNYLTVASMFIIAAKSIGDMIVTAKKLIHFGYKKGCRGLWAYAKDALTSSTPIDERQGGTGDGTNDNLLQEPMMRQSTSEEMINFSFASALSGGNPSVAIPMGGQSEIPLEETPQRDPPPSQQQNTATNTAAGLTNDSIVIATTIPRNESITKVIDDLLQSDSNRTPTPAAAVRGGRSDAYHELERMLNTTDNIPSNTEGSSSSSGKRRQQLHTVSFDRPMLEGNTIRENSSDTSSFSFTPVPPPGGAPPPFPIPRANNFANQMVLDSSGSNGSGGTTTTSTSLENSRASRRRKQMKRR